MFSTPKLRAYQQNAIITMRDKIASGKKRILLVLATGAGKTSVAAEIIRLAREKNKKTLFIAHRQELIYQAHSRFANIGVDAGIIMAGHKMNGYDIHVASIQTLIRREHPPADIIFIDECHRIAGKSYRTVLENYPDAVHIGLTATPYRSDLKPLGEFFDEIVAPVTMQQLIDDGFLVQPRYFGAKQDFSKIKIKMGDYDNKQMFEHVDKKVLYDGVVDKFKQFGYGKTLVFCINIEHSKKTCEAFVNAGYKAIHLDCDTDTSTRKRILKEFASGEWQILSNVALFTEGFDLPAINTIIINRATKAKGLYCLDEQTEILTEQGWKKDIAIGENVAAMIPQTGEIKYVPVLDTIRRNLEPNEFWVSLQSPTLNIKVTNKHKLFYRQRMTRDKRIGWSFKTAEEISKLSSGISLPISGMIQTKDIPLSDDELRFIAWVMTDGSINKYNNGIHISQGSHQEWLEEIQRVIVSCGLKFNRFIRKRDTPFNETSPATIWTISKGSPRGRDKHLKGWGYLEKWLSKDLSLELMNMSARQFEIFIHTLHLGDGAKQKGYYWTRRSYHIATGNYVMAERLQILGITKGWKANISVSYQNKNPLYNIHLKQKSFAVTGSTYDKRPKWQLMPSNSHEKCWCVENEIGTLITRRDGKVVIVGNCQIVGRGLRPHEEKKGCIIIDHGNNVYEHGKVEWEQEYSLEVIKKKKQVSDTYKDPVKPCPECSSLIHPRIMICPDCGYEFPPTQKIVEAEFEEIITPKISIPAHLRKRWADMSDEELEEYRVLKGYKKGWKHYAKQSRLEKEGQL